MTYILGEDADEIDYASYAAYLLTIRADPPEHIYDFASNSTTSISQAHPRCMMHGSSRLSSVKSHQGIETKTGNAR